MLKMPVVVSGYFVSYSDLLAHMRSLTMEIWCGSAGLYRKTHRRREHRWGGHDDVLLFSLTWF